MASKEIPFLIKITNSLHWAEKLFLIAFVVGVVLKSLTSASLSVISVSLTGLAIVYFIYAVRVPALDEEQAEKSGFTVLLGTTILPKVCWISCSVSLVAVSFYLTGMDRKSWEQMALIGSSSLLFAILLLGILSFSGMNLKKASPFLYRGIPVLLMDLYILLM